MLWLSGYINGNPEIHNINKAEDCIYSSYQDYLGLRNGTVCEKKIILDEFKNNQDYQKFVQDVIKESGKKKEDMREYLLE